MDIKGFQFINDPRPLDHARNLQVKRFLDSDCTHLFTVDSDCVPPTNTIQKLEAFNLPIIASPHPTIIDNEIGLMVVDKVNGGYRQHQPCTGLQKCDAVGGSGLLIKREVFEKMKPPYFSFMYDEEGYLSQGEDFYFCQKAKANGYEIYAYCDLVQNHIKEVVL
jgi:hypothetical protein